MRKMIMTAILPDMMTYRYTRRLFTPCFISMIDALSSSALFHAPDAATLM